MGMPVVIAATGGLPVVVATNGLGVPCTIATNGFGIRVTQSANGIGLPVAGVTFGPSIVLTGNTVLEHSAVNTVVGALSMSGTTGTPAYTLTDTAGGRFKLVGSSLQVAAATIDFETATSHNVTVSVTGVTPVVSATTFTIVVLDVSVAVPAAPTLTLTSGPTDNTPDFNLTGDLVVGDTVRFQYSTSSGFAGASELTNTIDAAEDTANLITFTTGALAATTWYFRARIERPEAAVGDWSNTVTDTITAASYSGPGDIVAGALAWYGLRAYSAAQCTGSVAAIRIVKASDGTAAQNINILTTGALDVATIAALGYAVKVTTWYDQSGAGRHLTNATLATMPTLNLTGLGSLPALQFIDGTDGQTLSYAAGMGAQAQPNSFSLIFRRVAANNYQGYLLDSASNGVMANNVANSMLFYNGSGLAVVPATDGAFHAAQLIADHAGAGSYGYVDGTNTALNLGATTGWAAGEIRIGANGARSTPQMTLAEVGIWHSAFSAGNSSAMNSNQHTYWGF